MRLFVWMRSPTAYYQKKIIINPHKVSKLHAHSDNDADTYKPPLTIWIHGTQFLRSRLFTHVFNGTPSLKLASEINRRYKAKVIANTLNKYNATRFPLNTFYIFCWSGKLNADLRERTAHHLYAELKRVIAQYEQTYHCMPRIQIITHSHGGNVALNLAKIKDPQDTLFVIDTLVLLACPVQLRTMSFIDNPMFRRIYSLYSSVDFVQVIAPQLFKKSGGSDKRSFTFPPFSNRCFPQRQHVTQVKMKVDGNAPWHNDFVQSKFLKLLPSIISELETWNPAVTNLPKTLPYPLTASVASGEDWKPCQVEMKEENMPVTTPKSLQKCPSTQSLTLNHIPEVTHSLSVHTAGKYFSTS